MTAYSLSIPVLSLADPTESGEGALDPLGLEAVAEVLALKLIPGVRERMSHPRYLTLIAVAASVCDSFDAQRVASDGISEPWLVFEWYVVEAFARANADGFSLPGRRKAQDCVRLGAGLSRDRYLKSPGTFGFHGVYRVLARDMAIIQDDGAPTVVGDDLIDAWARDRDLDGWHTGDGPGSDLRRDWRSAVADGLDKGRTDRRESWRGWEALSRHLNPRQPKRRERQVLIRLLDENGGHRREVVRFLASTAGQRVLTQAFSKEEGIDEQRIHQALRQAASPALALLLDAIAAYERCARLLSDAFEEIRHFATVAGAPVARTDLAAGRCVNRASGELATAVAASSRALAAAGVVSGFDSRFSAFATPLTPAELVVGIIDHHISVQSAKPPNGKRSWFERYGDGRLAIRPNYMRDSRPAPSSRYVQAYRCATLGSFIADLHLTGA